MRYFFRVEYDGTNYGGWQRQPNTLSIQEVLETTLSTVLRVPISIVGAGRTDAGVHARAQGAHFECNQEINFSKCMISVNAILPPDIAIYNLQKVPDSFNARFSAKSRKYIYSIRFRKCPLLYKRVWMLYYPIDWDRVAKECESILGNHDFAAFCASGSTSESTDCHIYQAGIQVDQEKAEFTIEANRFIYKMVRSLIGTLVDIGRGRLDDNLLNIIMSKDRFRVGETAPACGLVLDMVKYEGID